MKKIIIYIFLVFSFFSSSVFAAETTPTSSSDKSTSVIVTEKIPGAGCVPYKWGNDINTRQYKCTIKPGLGTVMEMFAWLIKYATFLAALAGVLMVAVAGIRMSYSWIDSWEKTKAKEMLEKVVFWLILLFLIGFILNTVAPWIYQ